MRRRRQRAAHGQSTVELALTVPILVLLLLALTDVSRVLATTAMLQNAAKQAAVLAARHVVSPVSCLQPQVQALVNGELNLASSANVALSEITPATQAYTGEEDIKATVAYSFTLIDPSFLKLGSAAHPIVLTAVDAEHTIGVTGADPGAAQTITATRNISDSGSYADAIGWTMPLTWTPTTDTDPSSGQVYTTTFRIWQSLDSTGTAPLPACPVGPAITAVPTAGYHYLWMHDTDPAAPHSYQYWVVATGPAAPPYLGRAGTWVQAPWP